MWLFSTDGTLVPLVLRLTLAIVMFPHGAQKVLGWFGGHGLQGTLGFFGSQGFRCRSRCWPSRRSSSAPWASRWACSRAWPPSGSRA
jgi:hypothetical protein